MQLKQVGSSIFEYLYGMFLLACLVFSFSSVSATEPLTVEDVLAVEADPAYGEYLAGECMTCHTGQNTNDSIPDIHGKEPSYIAGALL